MARKGVKNRLFHILNAAMTGYGRMWSAGAAVLIVLVVAMAPVAEAATNDEIGATAQDVLSDSDYQRDLPLNLSAPDDEAGEPSRSNAGASRSTERRSGGGSIRAPSPSVAPASALGGVGQAVLWVLALTGGALLVVYLLNRLPLLASRATDHKPKETRRKPDPAPEPRAAAAGKPMLDESDRLAAAGNYGEAVHALLLRSLEHIRRQLDPGLRPSLTSREIVSRVSLTESARTAFSGIVSASERSHFGGREPGKNEYLACRENYQRLATDQGGAS